MSLLNLDEIVSFTAVGSANIPHGAKPPPNPSILSLVPLEKASGPSGPRSEVTRTVSCCNRFDDQRPNSPKMTSRPHHSFIYHLHAHM